VLLLGFAALTAAALLQVRTAEAQAAGPCTGVTLGVSYGADPTGGSIEPGETDCYPIAGVSGGDQLSISSTLSNYTGSSPRWVIVDGQEATLCVGSVGDFDASCHLSGTSGWTIHFFDQTESGTYSYSAVVRRTNNPEGCGSLGAPAVWSFEAPRIDGSIDSPLDADCYSYSRSFGEPDGRYWFRAMRSSGDLQAHWDVYGPSGVLECSGYAAAPESACPQLASGQYSFVVDGLGGTGGYYATAKRLSLRTGCASLPSVAFDGPITTGTIGTAGEADCYSIPDVTASDRVVVGFDLAVSNGSPRWAVVDGSGTTDCDSRYQSGPCELVGTGDWSLIVYDEQGTGTFSYSATVRRVTDPSGCTSLGAPGVWSFEAPRLTGSVGGGPDADCYTFSRSGAEEDGTYWFRADRTSGDAQIGWSLYAPSGARECSGSSNNVDVTCKLFAGGDFAFVVENGSSGGGGSYYAAAKQLRPRAGCSTLPSVAYGAAPASGNISTTGEADCLTVPGAAVGDIVSIGFLSAAVSNANPRWYLVDGTGTTICNGPYSGGDLCTLSGTAGWSLIVYDEQGRGTFSYSLTARRLNNPQGCSSLGAPAAWSFTTPRKNGMIEGPLDAECFTFDRGLGEPDSSYWFRTVRTSGAFTPNWSIYGPSGARECTGSNNGPEGCTLLATGQFAFVVEAGSGQAGSYYATTKQLNSPSGCATLPSVAYGINPTPGNLSAVGEIDCYSLPATDGDILNFKLSGSADQLGVIGPNGGLQCRFTDYPCELSGDGPFALVLFSGTGTSSGSYQFRADCENVPCGLSETAIFDVSPGKVGQDHSVTLLLRGRDLELLEGAKLRLGGAAIVGDVQEAAPDGRAVEVRFDLSDAPAGNWNLEGSFLDGTTRTLPSAVHVEPIRPPRVSVQLVGRGVFRAGRPTAVTVEVSNSGNVDGVAVPVLLSGIPLGSTIEPRFQLQKPQGSLDDPELIDTTFDQATETIELEGALTVPMLIPRVPPGKTVHLEYAITAPLQGASYVLEATAGQCLGNAVPGSQVGTSAVRSRAIDWDTWAPCAKNVAGAIAGDVADEIHESVSSCFATGAEVGSALARGITLPLLGVHGAEVVSLQNGLDFGMNGIQCALTPLKKLKLVTKAGERIIKAAGLVGDAVGFAGDCGVPAARALMPQQVVGAFDPNDLIGPSGVGANHYIPGNQPLDYQILFENKSDATAPAQRVETTTQLDTAKFDPSKVLFYGVRFGAANYQLPYPSPTIDDVIDLRPAQNLQVHVTAATSPSGLVRFELQAIDPDTLEPPDDPEAGFLPPNVDAPEGEGALLFGAGLRDDLPSGTTLSNSAAITFDTNEAITTPGWTNTIDKSAPSPSIAATAGSEVLSATVSWGGSDDASGIGLWKIEVSRAGGPFELWTAATKPGSQTFNADSPGSYSFRAVAFDGAGNTGQSALAGLTLQNEQNDSQPTGTLQAPGPTAETLPVASSPKPLRCKKGFRKKKTVKGTARCIKLKKHRRSRHRH
jgi:hypothetical protein